MTYRISAEKLLRAMKYLDIGKQELALHLGVSYGLIASILRGDRGIKEEYVREIERLIEEQHATGRNRAQKFKEKKP